MTSVPNQRLILTIAAGSLSRFLPLLGRGFTVEGAAGGSVEGFICRACGISPEYLDERVQTVFLDGKAIDDLRQARVRDGSTLALSAAMPGLAGAVLRRGGAYAAMRRQISYEGAGPEEGREAIRVKLKLFNLVAQELGPGFLSRGIRVRGGDLNDFLDRMGPGLRSICRAAEWNGRPVACETAVGELPGDAPVLLRLVEAASV
jgi:hypothetical protein